MKFRFLHRYMYKCNKMNRRLINIVRLQSKKFIFVDGKNKLKFQVCHTNKTYHIPQQNFSKNAMI